MPYTRHRSCPSKVWRPTPAHPLLRTVSLDRNFYRPLTVSQYQRYAEQVPEDFRFVVKAPSLVTDALVRTEDGRGREPNPAFLNPELALREFVEPALEGLGSKVGALVFQISPLPMALLDRMPQVLEQLRTLLQALPPVASRAPDGVICPWRCVTQSGSRPNLPPCCATPAPPTAWAYTQAATTGRPIAAAAGAVAHAPGVPLEPECSARPLRLRRRGKALRTLRPAARPGPATHEALAKVIVGIPPAGAKNASIASSTMPRLAPLPCSGWRSMCERCTTQPAPRPWDPNDGGFDL